MARESMVERRAAGRAAGVPDAARGPGAPAPARALALALQRGAGNRALARALLQRTSSKKVGGVKVTYATSAGEATELCRAEAARHELDWDSLPEGARATILEFAQTPEKPKGEPAGLAAAYNLILSEKHEADRREARRLRREEVEEDDSEYNRLRSRIEGDDILEACLDWMKDLYVSGLTARENRTLGTSHTRAEIASAVTDWKREAHWVATNLAKLSNPHGYPVGGKDAQVGDTLDRRGEQGNIILIWGGSKINMHINPSD